MTHWKLWKIEPVIPPQRRDPARPHTPGRREMRLLCEGELVEHNRGSHRHIRRHVKRIDREQARFEQGLLWHKRRYCRAQDYQGRVEVPA